MAFTRITAAEAAALIKNGDNIGLSGFTPAGTHKAVTAEIAKVAHAEHEAGRPYQIGIFTGASTGQSCDGVLSDEHAIRYRAPYTTNSAFRKHVNAGELAYNDIHLGMMAQDLRYGFLGEIDWAILEVCAIEEDGKVYLTAAGGISPTVARLAKKGIILELNAFHSPKSIGIHDVYEPLDPPMRKPIMIEKVTDRIGTTYLQLEPNKIVGVVECNIPDEARTFKDADPITDKIGENVANFLMNEKKRGIIPSGFLPFQSGVGTTANAILFALGSNPDMPAMEVYTEVLQNAIVDLMFQERVKCASTCSLTVTNDKLQSIYDNMDFFKDKLVLRPSEISNNGRPLRTCQLNTDLRHKDDERHRRLWRLRAQRIPIHLHLLISSQGRMHLSHRTILQPCRPHRTRCQCHSNRAGSSRPPRQEPYPARSIHHRELRTPRLQAAPLGLSQDISDRTVMPQHGSHSRLPRRLPQRRRHAQG